MSRSSCQHSRSFAEPFTTFAQSMAGDGRSYERQGSGAVFSNVCEPKPDLLFDSVQERDRSSAAGFSHLWAARGSIRPVLTIAGKLRAAGAVFKHKHLQAGLHSFTSLPIVPLLTPGPLQEEYHDECNAHEDALQENDVAKCKIVRLLPDRAANRGERLSVSNGCIDTTVGHEMRRQ